MNHYPTPDELWSAKFRYDIGMDNCQDREMLRLAGGTQYWHLEGCGCNDFLSYFGDPKWPL
jgi:hypothetical protein